MHNISTAFQYNETDAKRISQLMATAPEKQITLFQSIANKLTDYAYWFLLSTLWVNDASIAPVDTWKKLFMAKRPNRSISMMKPNELALFKDLPNKLTLYRAHTADEADWISYTLSLEVAIEFAKRKKVKEVAVYKVKKQHCQALFLRRSEMEIICLDQTLVKKIR